MRKKKTGASWSMLPLVALMLALAALGLCGCGGVSIGEDSPHVTETTVSAGSDLTEDSQYVEVRLDFGVPLESVGDLASDLEVRVNGEEPGANNIQVEASVDGQDLVMRLVPTAQASGTDSSVYFALYDGLVEVTAAAEDGSLPHLRAQGGSSAAVIDEAVSFTVPSGVGVVESKAQTGLVSDKTPASVTFEVLQSAQLRCCTWLSFGDDFPLVMVHNHEFLRDTPETFAARLVQTIGENYGDAFEAEADGSLVTVSAREILDGQELDLCIVEGFGAEPAQGILGDGRLTLDLGRQAADASDATLKADGS